jgi:GDP-4-dehydro-6-deoxy-D-mannose reductase
MTDPVLLTGAAGLVGSHLVDALVGRPQRVIASYFQPTVPLEEIAGKAELVELDVRRTEAVSRLIEGRRPATIFHLAAQSLPTVSWEKPQETIEANVVGTVNLFEAIKAVRRRDPAYDPCVVVACSSAEYGASLTPERFPVDEDAPLLPLHPYGVSKVAQDLLTLQYWINDRIRGVRTRIFNTTGPRKQNDVVSDFAARAARVARHGGPLAVGNLETRRAILDVRDLVGALLALARLGLPGEVYNICGEKAYRIGDLIPLFEAAAGCKFEVAPDPNLLRPSDEPIIVGSTTRLKQATGWTPSIPIETTIRDVFEYEQRRLQRA